MRHIGIIWCFLVLFSSCKRNLKDVSWDAEVVAPLVTTSLTIGDLIKDDTNFVQSGKEISFVYNQPLESINLNLDSLVGLGVRSFKRLSLIHI